MKFVLIYNPTTYGYEERIDLLKSACDKRGIQLVSISFYDLDDDFKIKTLNSYPHYLSRIGYPTRHKLLEVINNNSSVEFDSFFDLFSVDSCFDLNLKRFGLKNLKTINKKLYKLYKLSLESVVDYLGGFPIVVKRSGMSKGEGVFRVDDLAQLENMIKLFDIENYDYSFKEFYPHHSQGRFITVDKKFIAGHLNIVGEDFRSNVGDNSVRKRENHEFSKEVKDYVSTIDSTLVSNFSGYDILFGNDGSFLACEKNAPCNFVMTQKMTGVDIAGTLIDSLISKNRML